MKSKMINDIKGFENFRGYEIFENGEIYSYWMMQRDSKGRLKKSVIGNKRKLIKGAEDSKGYLYISMRSIHNKRRHPKIHRLVSLAFIPNPENKPQINHIDCDKKNNHVDNLEWCSNSENQLHAFKHGLNKPHEGENNYQWHGNHKNCKPIRQVDLDGNEVAVYKSIAIASRETGFWASGISAACRGKTKVAYGHKWEYLNK